MILVDNPMCTLLGMLKVVYRSGSLCVSNKV